MALPITLYTPAPRDVFEIESPPQLIFDVKQGNKPFIRVRTQGQEVMLVIAINQYCQGSQLRAFQQRFDNLVEWDLSAMSIPASELDKALSSLILEPSDGASAPTAYWLSLSRA